MEATTIESPYKETFEEIRATMKDLSERHNQYMLELEKKEKEREKKEKEREKKEKEREKKEKELEKKEKEREKRQLEWEKAKEQRNEEWEKKEKEAWEKRQLEWEKSRLEWAESKERLQKTEKMMEQNTRLVGKLSNSFGELAEHLVAPNIVEKFQAIGFKVEKCCKNIEIFTPDLSKIITEIDIFIENGDTAIVVEVKSKLRENHLKKFIIKMEKFREYSDKRQDKRKFIGAIAAAIINDNERQEILDEGIYVLEQTGDTMKITAPEGFKPREW